MAKPAAGRGGGGKASPSSSPKVQKLAEAVKKANTGVQGTKKSGTSSNNLFAYSYTKPFYAKVEADKTKKKKAKTLPGETI